MGDAWPPELIEACGITVWSSGLLSNRTREIITGVLDAAVAWRDEHGVPAVVPWSEVMRARQGEAAALLDKLDMERRAEAAEAKLAGAIFNCETLEEQRDRAETERDALRKALKACDDALTGWSYADVFDRVEKIRLLARAHETRAGNLRHYLLHNVDESTSTFETDFPDARHT